MDHPPISVLCVDDNEWVAEAIERRLRRTPGFVWAGWLPSADDLPAAACERMPDIVLLDIDMPGRDAFDALRTIAERCPEVRVVMLSGHVRLDLVNRAFEAGAWGYLAKTQEMDAMLDALRRVAAGEVVMSPEVQAVMMRI